VENVSHTIKLHYRENDVVRKGVKIKYLCASCAQIAPRQHYSVPSNSLLMPRAKSATFSMTIKGLLNCELLFHQSVIFRSSSQ